MNPPAPDGEITDEATRAEIHALLPTLVARAPGEAAGMLDPYPDDLVSQMLESLNPSMAQTVLERFRIERRQKIIAAAPPATRQQWIRNEGYPENAIGLIRGQMLFEAETVELSLQAGSMVGVEREERLTTPWPTSFRFRHPWLQGNLFAGFIAAAVVGYFQGTIDRLVALAVFLPVVIGQSSNTGVQTLAVALRGMTLGELKTGGELGLITKETFLGLPNGALTGVSAALGMFVFATMQHSPVALKLSLVVFFSMAGSCLISGIFGASIPLLLRKFGTDPANASSIVLTTITDVTTLAVFLGLATWLV